MLAQSEVDRQYAESLLSATERATLLRQRESASRAQVPLTVAGHTPEEDDGSAASRFTSLFGLALRSCADNKINVAEAFRTGKVKPMKIPAAREIETDSDDDRKPAAIETIGTDLRALPFLEQCHVCYKDNVRVYTFACNHAQCTRCTKKLFKAALRDSTLLPLRCCDIPIDMNICTQLLKEEDAQRIVQRVQLVVPLLILI